MNIEKVLKEKVNLSIKDANEYSPKIKELEDLMGFQFPIWYKKFLTYNMNDNYFKISYDKSTKYKHSVYMEFLDFEDILDELMDRSPESLNLILKNKLIPMSNDNGGGDYFYFQFDKENVNIVRLFHDAFFEYELVSPNIETFFKEMKVF